MSFTDQRTVAKSRTAKRCSLCFERIEIGAPKVVRVWAEFGDFGTMHMHPECKAYEK